MIFFRKKKNDDSRSRRSDRLLALRLRKFGLFSGVLALAGTLVFMGYHTGSFKKIGGWASARVLGATAGAGFRVKDILVTGRVHIKAEELLSRFSIKENMPIFGVSLAAAQKSLTGIPWVRSVSISRRLPDTVIIALQERVPAALWQYQKKISVIDAEGVVLASDDLGVWQNLPLVVGEDAPKHTAELLALLDAEPVLARTLVSAIRVEGRRWDLRLNNGISVKLPEQDMELAVRRLVMAEEQKNIFGRAIAGIDLRQPDKLVVTPVAQSRDTPAKTNKKTSI